MVVHPHLHICRQIFLIHPRSKCVFLLVEGKSGCGCDDCENERKLYSLGLREPSLWFSILGFNILCHISAGFVGAAGPEMNTIISGLKARSKTQALPWFI